MKQKSRGRITRNPGITLETDLNRKTITLNLLGNSWVMMDAADALWLAKRIRLAAKSLSRVRLP